ncbi:MAG: nucleotidyltransferase domain-containing protein [Candidatus Margulisbacteria bacterium]|nr:nucleotidyltransferase domain-containing protein [Candidatus Margulisiibacteriota bacterium]
MIQVIPLTDAEIISNVKEIIISELPEAKAYLFGSRINGKAKIVSDFDICIKIDKEIPAVKLFSIEQKIDNLDTLRTIDISDYHRLNDFFKSNIDQTGVLI